MSKDTEPEKNEREEKVEDKPAADAAKNQAGQQDSNKDEPQPEMHHIVTDV